MPTERVEAHERPGRRGRTACAVLSLAALICMLPACMGAPVPIDPQADVEVPESFRTSGEAAVPERWWTSLEDEQLTGYVEQALSANRDLEAVWHAFHEARAVARRTGAAKLPAFSLFSDSSVFGNTDDGDDGEITLGGSLEFEVDLWGRLEAGRRADIFRARAGLDDYRTAAVALTAEVARTWFRLVEAELQVALLGEQVDANEKILSLIEPRVAAQQLRSVDLLRQEALVETTREALINAKADAEILRNQLAVLTGQAAGKILPNEEPTLAQLPPLPETGVPIERVRQRPDIMAARHRVMAGDQELGAALRDRYPRLTIDATMSSADGIFRNFLASFAAGLLAPAMDGGQRVAEIDRTRAQRNRLRATYAQAVLVAFREVEDALIEEDRQRKRIESLERQLDLSRRSAIRLREDYFNGQGSYIEVLSAIIDEQGVRRELLTARRLLLESRIGLHRALAGQLVTDREGEPS